MSNTTFTHLNERGEANMVDVTDKVVTYREALAEGVIYLSDNAFELLVSGSHKKGDVFAVARIAGIQAAKKTSELIPLCHPLMLSKVSVTFTNHERTEHTPAHVKVRATCKLSGQTGVEMEALTAATVALLTIYDMCKAVDPEMTISAVKLLEKRGGKTGHWQRSETNE